MLGKAVKTSLRAHFPFSAFRLTIVVTGLLIPVAPYFCNSVSWLCLMKKLVVEAVPSGNQRVYVHFQLVVFGPTSGTSWKATIDTVRVTLGLTDLIDLID